MLGGQCDTLVTCMNIDSLITRKSDVLATELDGELVLMSIDLGHYFGMVNTARRIWELLDQPKTVGHLVQALEREYDAPAEVLRRDAQAFLMRLCEEGLVQIG